MISINKTSNRRLCWLVALLLFALGPLSAQDVKTTVILPQRDLTISNNTTEDAASLRIHGEISGGSRVYPQFGFLQFDCSNNIPEGAMIRSLKLRIYLKDVVDENNEQTLVACELNNFDWANRRWADWDIEGQSRIARSKVSPADVGKAIDLKIKLKDVPKLLSLVLYAGAEDYSYYSTAQATSEGVFGMQPRLIVEYSLPSRFMAGNWAQLKNDPQHSGQQTWRSNIPPNDVDVQFIIKGGTEFYIKNNPIIYDNDLIVPIEQTGNGKKPQGYYIHRYSLESSAKLIASSERLDGIIKYQPVLIAPNLLLCITGRQGKRLNILDITNDFKQVPYLDYLFDPITAPPVIGTDGSLYLSTTGGLLAYPAYKPGNKIRPKWKFAPLPNTANHHFSSVSLSKDERKAYVVLGDTDSLYTIDNTDGKILNRTALSFSINTSSNEAFIPIPIVDRNTGSVLLSSGDGKGKQVKIFDEAGTLKHALPKGDYSYSQAVVNSNGAYVVKDGYLLQINLETFSVQDSASFPELNPASTLVTNIEGFIYVLNTEANREACHIFLKDLLLTSETSLSRQFAGENLRNGRLLLAPDGNLVVGNDNFIALIRPSVFIDRTPNLKLDQINDQSVYYAAESIRVKGSVTVQNPNNAILYSRGSISFEPGFKVKKGAKLTCKVVPE